MTARTCFVTGTDTGSGKTVASIMLIRAFSRAGYKVCGMKPVASGCIQTPSGLVSEDALALLTCSNSNPDYAQINPVALEMPCSPNFAALREGREIKPDELENSCRRMMESQEVVIIEGIGGWRTPVFGPVGMSLLVKRLQIPVIVVVGLRLGCINHSLLTLEALRSDKVKVAGWIASFVDPEYTTGEQTVSFLTEIFGSEPLAIIPHLAVDDIKFRHVPVDIKRLAC